jgi:hypothetical protein
LRAQRRLFDRFRAEYNDRRPHEALGNGVPAEFYQPAKARLPNRTIAMVFAPVILVAYDAQRRYDEMQRRTAPIEVKVDMGDDELERECTCTGTGDPLCSEIPGQTCRVSH